MRQAGTIVALGIRDNDCMRVAVLGAGLQGACVALELALHGIRVDLFDREPDALLGASGHNEGKLHLGFVYAADNSLRTARLMMRAAACFSSNIRRWVGSSLDSVPVSSPFYYIVHRDSLVSADQIRAHLEACRGLALEHPNPKDSGYFGSDFHSPSRELTVPERDGLFDERTVRAAFLTPEISIDPKALAAILRKQLRSVANVDLRPNTRVMAARPQERFVDVMFAQAGVQAEERYDHVVNALWDGRLAIDETAGFLPERPWLWRMKHFLRIRAADDSANIPSATIVLGPFGDVVNYMTGEIYLSWYPDSCQDRSSDLKPPTTWLPATPEFSASLRVSMPQALSEIVPSLAQLPRQVLAGGEINGGIIFAFGKTDVDDPESGLHQRWSIGVRSKGRYHSINTGKYTTAPLFATEVADRIRCPV
jgi:hypothetical protein